MKKPVLYRYLDDDQGPTDYHAASSVAEGRKQLEKEMEGRSLGKAVARRRAEIGARVDSYGTHARRSTVVPTEKAQLSEREHPLRSMGAKVEHVAYPEGYEPQVRRVEAQPSAEETGTSRQFRQRDVACEVAGTQEEVPEYRDNEKRNRRGAPERLERTPYGVMAEGEVSQTSPEWLRVAQQNQEISPGWEQQGRQRENRYEAGDYEAAGYPAALVQAQQEENWHRQAERYGAQRRGGQRAEMPRRKMAQRGVSGGQPPEMEAGMKQHGYAPQENAVYAPYGEHTAHPTPPPLERRGRRAVSSPVQQPGYEQPVQGDVYGSFGGYPGYDRGAAAPVPPPMAYGQDVAEESAYAVVKEEAPWKEWLRRVPWLGAATAVLALAAVLLWIFQMNFDTRRDQALLAREQGENAVANSHPYRYRELIENQAQVNNLHPAFIAAIVLNESSFNPEAESRVGARGLMQMMPDTAEWVHGKIARGTSYNFDMMYEPTANVQYACWYINYLSGEFWSDPVLVAAAFHAGQGTVKQWLNDSRYSPDNQTIALEDMMDGPTKNYVTKVLKAYSVYKRLYYEDVRM